VGQTAVREMSAVLVVMVRLEQEVMREVLEVLEVTDLLVVRCTLEDLLVKETEIFQILAQQVAPLL
jgi:hypothetical protein